LKISGLDSKIRTLDSKFDLKISGLDPKIKALDSKLDSKFDKAELGRWLDLLGWAVVYTFVVSAIPISTMSYLLMIYRF
jgi:hypothetical protein